MTTILLSELKAVMAMLETLPRLPVPAPVAPVIIDIPESERFDEFPYEDKEFAAWLEDEWEQTEECADFECGPGTPLYEYYMANRLYPKLLQAGYRYITEARAWGSDKAQLVLDRKILRMWLVYNIITDIPQPDDITPDYLCNGRFRPAETEALLKWVQGFVEALFDYDLLNVRHIAFTYGERLRLYTHTEDGWTITRLGRIIQDLPEAEAAAFLVMLETVRTMLDQDDWFVSYQRLRWLLDESPVRFRIFVCDEEGQFAEELKRDDGWLRRLRWLDIVTYTHGYTTPYGDDIIGFNEREVDLTSFGRTVTEAIVADWEGQSGKPPTHSLMSVIQQLERSPSQIVSPEEEQMREMLSKLYTIVSALQSDFSRVREGFEQRLSMLEDEARRDQIYEEAYEQLHQLAMRSLREVDVRVEEYKRLLGKRLGKTWGELGSETRQFLSSAEYLYDQNKGAKALDFAPAAVEYCKVVEREIGERLSRSLSQHLGLSRPLALGQIAYLLQGSQPKQYRKVQQFISSHYPQEVQDFILQELPNTLKRITKEYRNGAAHNELLSQAKIEEFRTILLGSEDASGTSLLQQIVQIQPIVS
jgi:hypothetical protein